MFHINPQETRIQHPRHTGPFAQLVSGSLMLFLRWFNKIILCRLLLLYHWQQFWKSLNLWYFNRMIIQTGALHTGHSGTGVSIGVCVWFELSTFHFRAKKELWESPDPEGPTVCPWVLCLVCSLHLRHAQPTCHLTLPLWDQLITLQEQEQSTDSLQAQHHHVLQR